MRKIFLACIISLFIASTAHAGSSFSANGFKCEETATASKRALVECTGSFPGVTGIFGGVGYDIVHVEFSPDNRRRYFYMSDTGCLILNAADNTALATDRSGTRKQFAKFTDAMAWCYSSPTSPPKGR